MRIAHRSIFAKIIVGLLVLGAPRFAFGDTMSSTSFVITTDDISTGGGNSTSASFISESDIGGRATGEAATSASFAACAGYPCTLNVAPPSITFSVSPNSIAFGTITSGATASGTTTITTTENATNGYVTTVVGDGHFRNAGGSFIGDVSDGAVTTGTNEYGIGLTGTDRSFSDDESVTTTPRTVATNAGAVTGSAVVVTFKVAPGSTSAAGSYSQIATFITSGSF